MFPKEDLDRWPKGTWKDHELSTLHGNANQKAQWHITSHLLEWLSSKILEIVSIVEDVEERESLCTVGGNVNWCSHYG